MNKQYIFFILIAVGVVIFLMTNRADAGIVSNNPLRLPLPNTPTPQPATPPASEPSVVEKIQNIAGVSAGLAGAVATVAGSLGTSVPATTAALAAAATPSTIAAAVGDAAAATGATAAEAAGAAQVAGQAATATLAGGGTATEAAAVGSQAGGLTLGAAAGVFGPLVVMGILAAPIIDQIISPQDQAWRDAHGGLDYNQWYAAHPELVAQRDAGTVVTINGQTTTLDQANATKAGAQLYGIGQ